DGIFYTRAGIFTIDSEGFLVNGRADKVQGVTLDASGNPSGTLQDLNLTVTNNPPRATSKANFVANLDARENALGSAGTATGGSGVDSRFQFLTGVNDQIIFDVGGGALTASLITHGGLKSGGQYDANAVATAIKTALELQNGNADTYAVSYSTTTKKFSITNTIGNAAALALRHTDTTTSVNGSTASDDLGFSTASNDTVAVGSSATSDNQVQFNVVAGRNQFTITVDGGFYMATTPSRTVTVTAGGYTGDGLAQAIESAINSSDQSDQVNRIRAVRVTFNSGANVNRFQIVSQTTGGDRTINIPSDSNSFAISASSIKVTEGTLGVLGTTNLSVNETFAFTAGLNDVIEWNDGVANRTASLITNGLLTPGTVVTAQQVATAIKTALEATDAGGAIANVYTATYDSTADRFTITNNAGNFAGITLRWTVATSTAAGTLGFSTAADDAIAVAASTTSDTSLTTALANTSSLDVAGTGGFLVTDPSNLLSSNFSTSIILFDSLGSSHSLNVFFRKIGENIWEYNGIMQGRDLVGPTADGQSELVLYGRMWFNSTGGLDIEDKFTGALVNGVTFPRANRFNFSGGANQNQLVNFDFGTSITTDASLQGGLDGVTQFAGSSAVINQIQDGFTTGTLISVSVNRNGNVTGQFTNGQTRDLARIILANFNAPHGLSSIGNSLFSETQTSGQPILGQATTAGFGVVLANSIEISNVDIAEEFVRLIRDQQAFQANARVISTTSRMLDEVVNLTR
ncbi:MAG: flagellar hook-basal body complex protein, partial [Nitrospinota bacterium]